MSCIELKKILDPKDLHAGCFSLSSAAIENGKRFSFDNRSNADICRVKIDGCLITDNSLRKCDFFFEVEALLKNTFLLS